MHLVSNGGAFGGKEDMSIQAQTSLMAWLVRRPVKMTLTRLESFHIHPKRHPIELNYKIGCDNHGRITAVKARIIGDKGAYASVGAKVMIDGMILRPAYAYSWSRATDIRRFVAEPACGGTL